MPMHTHYTHTLYKCSNTNALIGAHSTHYSHNRSRKPPADGVKGWVSLLAVRTVHSAFLFLAKPRKNAKYLVNIAWLTHYTYCSHSTAYSIYTIPTLKKTSMKAIITESKSPTTYNKPLRSNLKYQHISANRKLLKSPIVGQTGEKVSPHPTRPCPNPLPDRIILSEARL